jgi:hypothetical protein
MSSNSIERELTQIACEQVILQAARIYAADLEPSVDYSAFLVIGADEVLCLPDELTPASAKQGIQWQKYQWIRWASFPRDLTLIGCIRWLMLSSSQDGEDCVCLDQVLEVLRGHRA